MSVHEVGFMGRGLEFNTRRVAESATEWRLDRSVAYQTVGHLRKVSGISIVEFNKKTVARLALVGCP